MFERLSQRSRHAGIVVAAAASFAACSDTNPTALETTIGGRAGRSNVALAPDHNDPPAPAPLVTVQTTSAAVTLWPYTGDDFTGTPKDPINAIFTGYADPLMIRAALRRLDGNRTAFGLPAAAPFNCTWKDAIGDEQAGFGDAEGWTGSAVQLACGDWGIRFHMRLFKEGTATLAGTHMDLNIPGTNEHEVISWELPEQILAIDMIRSGVLGIAPQLSAPISPTPTFREIRAPVYAGMPTALKALVGVLGGPGIPSDGRARLFHVGTAEPIVPDVVEQEFTIQFNQIIPKPFCGGPTDYLRVQGPLLFTGVARVTPAGTYHREHRTTGQLLVVPVNPLTGQPIGAALNAQVSDDHVAGFEPGGASARANRLQQLFDAEGTLVASQEDRISAGTRGNDNVTRVVRCTP